MKARIASPNLRHSCSSIERTRWNTHSISTSVRVLYLMLGKPNAVDAHADSHAYNPFQSRRELFEMNSPLQKLLLHAPLWASFTSCLLHAGPFAVLGMMALIQQELDAESALPSLIYESCGSHAWRRYQALRSSAVQGQDLILHNFDILARPLS